MNTVEAKACENMHSILAAASQDMLCDLSSENCSCNRGKFVDNLLVVVKVDRVTGSKSLPVIIPANLQCFLHAVTCITP